MKPYETLTRETIDVDASVAKYFTKETHRMQDWSDKMLDLILNGPTLNAFAKDEVRAMLRQAYTALKRYEMTGPMASPFINDPASIVALAFRELHPGVNYTAQLVPELHDETGAKVYGETLFPDDGSDPIISISAEAPINAGPELLAHELAHVIAGPGAEHGPEWEAAEKAIGDKYDELIEAMFPDSDELEAVITPHKVGDGGIIAMPLRENVPEPGRPDWKLVNCPICGAECWESDLARQAMAAEPELRAACTACALKAGTAAGGRK